MRSVPLTRPMGRGSLTTTTASKTESVRFLVVASCLCLCSVMKAKDLYHEAKINRGDLKTYTCMYVCSVVCDAMCMYVVPTKTYLPYLALVISLVPHPIPNRPIPSC